VILPQKVKSELLADKQKCPFTIERDMGIISRVMPGSKGFKRIKTAGNRNVKAVLIKYNIRNILPGTYYLLSHDEGRQPAGKGRYICERGRGTYTFLSPFGYS
jgi:hypothetical protein